jgi:hypothetical protein
MEYLNTGQRASLVNRLLRLTENGKLKWHTTNEEYGPYFFTASTAKFSFTIQSRDRDDVDPFQLAIFTRDEARIDSISTDDPWELESEGEVLRKVSDLYDLVKRTTLKLDVVVNELFEDLESLDDDG